MNSKREICIQSVKSILPVASQICYFVFFSLRRNTHINLVIEKHQLYTIVKITKNVVIYNQI